MAPNPPENQPTNPPSENKTPAPPAVTPEKTEEEETLIALRDEYKSKVSSEQYEVVKNLSIPKQIKILKAFQPKVGEPITPPVIPPVKGTPILPKNPAETPAEPDLPVIQSFAERNKVGGEWYERTYGSKMGIRSQRGEKYE